MTLVGRTAPRTTAAPPPSATRLRLAPTSKQDTLPLRGLTTPAAPLGPPVLAAVDPRNLPAPDPWMRQLAVGVVEVLMGRRPARQLQRWADPAVFRVLHAGSGRGIGPEARPGTPVQIVRVRASQPSPDAIEGVVLLRAGGRVRAMTLRTEALRGRWVCTDLDVV